MNKKIIVIFELKSPLMHFGDEMSGTMQTMRRMRFLVNNQYLELPVLSGNALRGKLRTLIMQHYLYSIGIGINSISQNLYYTLFNGGALKSGGIEDLDFKRKIRECCPPLVLLGSAYGNQMTEGKLKVGIVKPICKEFNNYNSTQSDTSIYSGMLGEVFHTRLDRLKSNIEETLPALAKQPVQMKYEAETLSAGTKLECTLFVDMYNEIELSCIIKMLELLQDNGFVGGKAAAGYGAITLTHDCTTITSEAYDSFLAANKQEIVKFINYLEEVLS